MNLVSPSLTSYASMPTTGHRPSALFGRSTAHMAPLPEESQSAFPWLKLDLWSPTEAPSKKWHVRVTGIGKPVDASGYASDEDKKLIGTEWKNIGELAYHTALNSTDYYIDIQTYAPNTTFFAEDLMSIAEGKPERVLQRHGIEYETDADPAALEGWDVNQKDAKGYTIQHRLATSLLKYKANDLIESVEGVDRDIPLPDGRTTFEYLLTQPSYRDSVSYEAKAMLKRRIEAVTKENYDREIGPVRKQWEQWQRHAEEVAQRVKKEKNRVFEVRMQGLLKGEKPSELPDVKLD
jgi:hypothetical protein